MQSLIIILLLNLITFSVSYSQNNQKKNPTIYYDDNIIRVGYVVKDPLEMDWDSKIRNFYCFIMPYDKREIKELYILINKKKINEMELKYLLDNGKIRNFKKDKNNYHITCNLDDKIHKDGYTAYVFSYFFLMSQYKDDVRINGLNIISDKGEFPINKPIELTR